MEPDFSGWASKAGLKCKDGRTIMPNAFQHQDTLQVPLVWQHGHSDPENVLGHAILENRKEGVYAYCFLNDSPKAEHMAHAIINKDIRQMSIWANDLIERSKKVIHGSIREVSLVLSGANPGAFIENISIRHSDGDIEELDEDVIIHTGLDFDEVFISYEDDDDSIVHADDDDNDDDEDDEVADDETVKDVYDSLSPKQKDVVHYMIGEALASKGNGNGDSTKKDDDVKHNLFEDDGGPQAAYLSHDDMKDIVADATKRGSLKEAVEEYALAHGIDDIEVLFPDAQALDKVPEFLSRRTEWVSDFLGATRKTPFSRIKTLSADITLDEARAKGYVKGSMKKEEFFGVLKRVTTPTTVYKKQKLDRDDMIDITDFDVVAWLKAEMRLMLDEEVARAGLIGDGRDVSHDDKINEQNIRPIAKDNELYTTTLFVNLDDANSSLQEFIEAVILNRHHYKGSGMPTMYMTESNIGRFLLLKDGLGRRLYNRIEDLATELRMAKIVPVEVMEDEPNIIAIIVNPTDYVYGATKGGEVSMFDDFDIDYNQYKYLLETRLCGALTKIKSAMVVRKTDGNLILANPAAPTWDAEEGKVSIVNTTGVVYKDGSGATVNAAGSPYTVPANETITIFATPASGYYFSSTIDKSWSFRNRV